MLNDLYELLGKKKLNEFIEFNYNTLLKDLNNLQD